MCLFVIMELDSFSPHAFFLKNNISLKEVNSGLERHEGEFLFLYLGDLGPLRFLSN